MGNLEVPQIDMYEALTQEIEMIAQALILPDSETKIPNARNAAHVWKIVEALRKSYQLGGIAQNV